MNKTLLQKSGLSLDRLQNFCMVADAGGITRAADGEPARQSLYSRQIRELGEFFGTELTRRQGKGIVLTEAGVRLARVAREQFAALSEFQKECASEPVTLTLAAGNSVLEWSLMPAVAQLCKAIPKVQVTIVNQRTHEIIASLQDLRVDLAIVRKNAVPPRIKHLSFSTLEYALFVPSALGKGLDDQQVLAAMSKIPLAMSVGGDFRQNLNEAARKSKAPLHVTLSCASFTLAARALETGRFAAILPTVAAETLRFGPYRIIKIPFLSQYERHLCIAWNPRLAAVRPVIEKAVECLAVHWKDGESEGGRVRGHTGLLR